jgi:hypothetical protein
MSEMLTNGFVMYGARTAVAGGWSHIQEQVDALESAVNENTGLAFDLAKTVIESTCRTILTERHIEFESDDDLPGLFKTVKNNLPFLPASASSNPKVRKSLAQTLGGLSAAIQGICELRNTCGFASHGSGEPRPVLESVQAILAAEATDTIVGFLYRIHTQDREILPSSPDLYDSNADFNEYVDDAHDRVQIYDEDFMPSRILFELAPEPYRLYLAEYKQENPSVSTEDQTVLPIEEHIVFPSEEQFELSAKETVGLK